MVIPEDAVALLAGDDDPFLLKLVPIAEANEAPLRKIEKVDRRQLVFQLEGQVLTPVQFLVDRV